MTGENVNASDTTGKAAGKLYGKDLYNVVGTTNGTTFTPTWNKGWNFYASQDGQGPTIFFPSDGFRDVWSVRFATGNAVYVGSDGYYWVGVPNSATSGCYLLFNSGGVNPKNATTPAYAFSVRPVREQ